MIRSTHWDGESWKLPHFVYPKMLTEFLYKPSLLACGRHLCSPVTLCFRWHCQLQPHQRQIGHHHHFSQCPGSPPPTHSPTSNPSVHTATSPPSTPRGTWNATFVSTRGRSHTSVPNATTRHDSRHTWNPTSSASTRESWCGTPRKSHLRPAFRNTLFSYHNCSQRPQKLSAWFSRSFLLLII